MLISPSSNILYSFRCNFVNLDISGILRIQGLDVSQNIHKLDTSANSYENRLDDIDSSFNQTLTLKNVILKNILDVSAVDISTSLVIPVLENNSAALDISGSIIFNKETNSFEGYSNGNWGSLGGVKSIDQRTFIDVEESSKKS